MNSWLLPADLQQFLKSDLRRVLAGVASGTLTVEVELVLMGISKVVLWQLVAQGYISARFIAPEPAIGKSESIMPRLIEPKSLTSTGRKLLSRLRQRNHGSFPGDEQTWS
jgi:hypothetical protein